MAMRLFHICKELNIGVQAAVELLKAMGVSEAEPDFNLKLSDEIGKAVLALGKGEGLKDILDESLKREKEKMPAKGTGFKIVGKIDLDSLNRSSRPLKRLKTTKLDFEGDFKSINVEKVEYEDNRSFAIEEITYVNPSGNAIDIKFGNLSESNKSPLYSVLIGTNGVGKSNLLRDIADFFIDLHACVSSKSQNPSFSKSRVRAIRYRIDGVKCYVVRLEKKYLASLNDRICTIKDLRLPLIVACHFGAFDKFHHPSVNSSQKNKYNVPCYKYVGSYVNGNIIATSAIVFRLLFVLNQEMSSKQRANIRSILEFIGYDCTISLQYSLKQENHKESPVSERIKLRAEADADLNKLARNERNALVANMVKFYKNKTYASNLQHSFILDFSEDGTSAVNTDELSCIYRLKKYDVISSVNVVFSRNGEQISSDQMSSGEFSMLATVLSITAAAIEPHTLVLLDEPEVNQHPNWQMTIIDNLDCALADLSCHLLIASHSHLLVSDLPMERSSVVQMEKDSNDELHCNLISSETYGWSPEEVLLKVFKTATERNKYFAEVIAKFIKSISEDSIDKMDADKEVAFIEQVSRHLSDVDPMKKIATAIVNEYRS